MDRHDRTSALLFRLGGLGDLLVALPSLRLLREEFPAMTFHLIGRRDYGELLRRRGVVDEVHSADDSAWLPLFRGPEEVSGAYERLSGYDLKVGWFHGLSRTQPRIRETRASSLYSSIRMILYDPAAGLPLSRYFFDATCSFISPTMTPAAAFDEYIRLPGAAVNRRSRFAVLHPGSGSLRKCWPPERFLEIAAFLADRGFTGALVAGEADEVVAARLGAAVLPAGWSRVLGPPLPALAEMLESAALYVGNDSGVTHLAAACGANVIALFLRDNEPAWRPFGRTLVLSADDLSRLTPAEVEEALLRTSVFSPTGDLC